MKSFRIEVDEEVYRFLQAEARRRLETPNTVLRRHLLDREDRGIPFSPQLREVRVSAWGRTADELSKPILPLDIPNTLDQVLRVLYRVREHEISRKQATRDVAMALGLSNQTVADKYARALKLTTAEFDELLEDMDLRRIQGILLREFPEFEKTIVDVLDPLRKDKGDENA